MQLKTILNQVQKHKSFVYGKVRKRRIKGRRSLLALQILLAHADLAPRPKAVVGEPIISPRKVLIEIRREIHGSQSRRVLPYRKRLERCRADDRRQTSPKASRTSLPRHQFSAPSLTNRKPCWSYTSMPPENDFVIDVGRAPSDKGPLPLWDSWRIRV